MNRIVRSFFFLLILTSCTPEQPQVTLIGKFQAGKDLYLPQFDCKTDVDDLHSVAGVATILADPRFKDVSYHAVAGAYGIQEGLYVPANELFNASFGSNWSDAHSNRENALREVTLLVVNTLKKGGNVWIAEAGQSDFSSDLVRNIKKALPEINVKQRINLVQHSEWNENNTGSENLAYVKKNISYFKIPDGNVLGNGSPGFVTDEAVNWKNSVAQPEIIDIWEMALSIANKYNGKEDRYENPAIANGGMDFSDVSETCWIFGFESLYNIEQFFKEFSGSQN